MNILKSSSKIQSFLILAIGSTFIFLHPDQAGIIFPSMVTGITILVGVKTGATAYTEAKKGKETF